VARWWRFKGKEAQSADALDADGAALPEIPQGARLATDDRGRSVVLFSDQWLLKFFGDRNPGVEVSPIPFDKPAAIALDANA
jgi:hypothetical protein